MEATHGTWGNRTRTFAWDGGIVTILELEKFKRCSWHFHNTTFNQFYVISGKLGVKTDKGYTTVMTAGQSFTVEPGVKHEFQTYEENAIVEEIAYVRYNSDDIHRLQLGGDLDKMSEKE